MNRNKTEVSRRNNEQAGSRADGGRKPQTQSPKQQIITPLPQLITVQKPCDTAAHFIRNTKGNSCCFLKAEAFGARI